MRPHCVSCPNSRQCKDKHPTPQYVNPEHPPQDIAAGEAHMAHAKKEVIGVNFVKDTSQPERRETRGASDDRYLKGQVTQKW